MNPRVLCVLFAVLTPSSASAGCCSTRTDRLVPPLRAKVNEIVSACGSTVMSTFRRGARRPDGKLSNHALWRAADLHGNPRCIYRHLKGWPGGYSTDYASAPEGPHVHISYNPNSEWGSRFAHVKTKNRVAKARNVNNVKVTAHATTIIW